MVSTITKHLVNSFFTFFNQEICKNKKVIFINGKHVKRFGAKWETPPYNELYDVVKYSRKVYYFIDEYDKEHYLLSFTADASDSVNKYETPNQFLFIDGNNVYYNNCKIFEMDVINPSIFEEPVSRILNWN